MILIGSAGYYQERPEYRHANLGGEPSTKPYSKPRPNRPGEVGILGFVDSALESSQRSPETRPPGGSRGFLFFEPRVSIKRRRRAI